MKNLTNRTYGAGIHSVSWDGRDNAGNRLATGVHFYRLTSGSFIETKRMVRVRQGTVGKSGVPGGPAANVEGLFP